MYGVYVLQNPAGKFYIGISDNVPRRVADHNSGKAIWIGGWPHLTEDERRMLGARIGTLSWSTMAREWPPRCER